MWRKNNKTLEKTKAKTHFPRGGNVKLVIEKLRDESNGKCQSYRRKETTKRKVKNGMLILGVSLWGNNWYALIEQHSVEIYIIFLLK